VRCHKSNCKGEVKGHASKQGAKATHLLSMPLWFRAGGGGEDGVGERHQDGVLEIVMWMVGS